MTFDHELTLINITTETNDMADSIEVEEKTTVLCDRQSVTRSEHYAAAASGLKPEQVFVLNKYNYNGQQEVEFEGNRYTVLRTYESKNADMLEALELVCEGSHING